MCERAHHNPSLLSVRVLLHINPNALFPPNKTNDDGVVCGVRSRPWKAAGARVKEAREEEGTL